MKETLSLARIEIDQLRIGMHVYLDVGWMAHPFPLSNFKITTPDQIRVIASLGLKSVRYCAAKSDPPKVPEVEQLVVAAPEKQPAAPVVSLEQARERAHKEALAAQRDALALCESQYNEAARCCDKIGQLVKPQPKAAGQEAEALAGALVDKLLSGPEMCIRLLSGSSGDKAADHAMNVAVLSLLLGQTFGLARSEMLDLGVGSLMHDIGKVDLPESVRHFDAGFAPGETLAYEEHVAHGVRHARSMGLSAGAQIVIAQHHEMADGSGFPMRLNSERITAASRIVAMVNRYDNLCNPHRGSSRSMTPHEALSTMFSQAQSKFDTSMLGAFIKMMGVYPPGSTVQLTDDRHALVVSVNSSRPLKPRVMVHDPRVPRDQALILDLEQAPRLGIRRSMKPTQLPAAAVDYLAPRPRVAYYFEASRELASVAAPMNAAVGATASAMA